MYQQRLGDFVVTYNKEPIPKRNEEVIIVRMVGQFNDGFNTYIEGLLILVKEIPDKFYYKTIRFGKLRIYKDGTKHLKWD